MDTSLRALNRFGLGAHLGERGRLTEPRGWLLDQLEAQDGRLDPSGLPSHEDVAGATRRLRDAQAANERPAVQAARQALQGILGTERRTVLTHRAGTSAPYVERLVAFWSNHLCVSVEGKQPLVPLAGLYEREAIRPHVLGRFSDMMLASARHPAMLLYLDNFQSVGPDSVGARQAVRRPGRQRGLNENYAREMLELHTLGVDGGYTQQDVEELARTLTGWTVSNANGADGGQYRDFVFSPPLHQPGSKTILGKRYAEDGEAEGEAVIRDLCAHPATAAFLAGKLVRHFVADIPPQGAIDRIASVFSETDGNLREVARALVGLEEAWDPDRRKLRSPQDWVVAAVRALDSREVPSALVRGLGQLRHPLWAPQAPKGYGDMVGDWADPDSLMNRAELARRIATLATRAAGDVNPLRLLDVLDIEESDPLTGFLFDTSIRTDERVALALAGPAFQWR